MICKLKGIYKRFDDLDVLNNLNLDINKEEIICIVGPSGCGKSTLLNIISGLIKPDKGKITGDLDLVGYVFQEDRLLPFKTVYENIAIVGKEKNHKKIIDLIYEVGLKGFEDSYPNNLSGGMRQRCSIARAFYFNSKILLMDEPFKSLDYNLKVNMIDYLIKLWDKSKSSIVFVTHNIDEALLLGNRIIVLSNRPINVSKIFNIDIHQSKRSLTDKHFTYLRNQIIDLLSNDKEE
ncbi:MAG: ABC transporter ATP-binding protein [Tepidibacter sp.]|jgi:NitT/TauT family transport system ATP-binding protein|uniref:ABC transporter ATP-binding protein n=1 Tax=Tepidibacter sp. TaxID=2529387 RepID=UPI0025DB7715|nr:ABC transporter ATP-binding protein [Tepidibacter sp.]MCT4509970.1 ABC transporter ATP-binding protein [Tepidibacter sp.]